MGKSLHFTASAHKLNVFIASQNIIFNDFVQEIWICELNVSINVSFLFPD